jgi:NhaC family Na+:H+ antiporter
MLLFNHMTNLSQPKRPSLVHAFIPIAALIIMLALNVWIFKDDAIEGSNQMALLLSAAVAAIVALSLGFKWKFLLEGIKKSIGSTMSAIIILLLIGALAGTWLLSGVVPAMVYYGLKILSPEVFLVAACVISAIVSLATGSSWSTIATIGIALLGIGQALGISDGLIAGSIISGAYFGDKMSPLSDTTNLAPAMAGTDLFTHIKHMIWTTGPSIGITLVIFAVIGGFGDFSSGSSNDIDAILLSIETNFNITPLLFLVPVGVITLIILKVPAIPALLAGVLLGGIFAIIFQSDVVSDQGLRYHVDVQLPDGFDESSFIWDDGTMDNDRSFVGPGDYLFTMNDGPLAQFDPVAMKLPGFVSDQDVANDSTLVSTANLGPQTFTGAITRDGSAAGEVTITVTQSSGAAWAYISVINAMSTDMAIVTHNDKVDDILSTGGMFGMMNTIWLIICAMSFGGIMEVSGLLQRITESIVKLAKSTGSLIASTAVTCGFLNVTASDQYLAIVVPGRMFAKTFRERGIKPENLSRTLEDTGTVTSVLVPWNTCGATQSTVLGVATGEYWMFCFFNLLSPIMTVIFGYTGIKVTKFTEEEQEANRIADEQEAKEVAQLANS